MNRDTFNRKYGHSSIAESEMDRKYRVYLREQEEMQRMYEAAINAQRSQSSTAGGGSATSSVTLTPFIFQSWGINEENEDWGLYRLKSDGSTVPVENAPPLEGPTVFAKNNINGLHYYITYSFITGLANFGTWDSETGDWQFLEESGEVLRHVVPASLQCVEGDDNYPSYFIYTDNSQYTGPGTSGLAPKTFRIDLATPVDFELTELHEWEIPAENYGAFPISTFYQLPVNIPAIPPQDLYQVIQYGADIEGFPQAVLLSINGDTYESTFIDYLAIEGLSIDAVKLSLILDRTDYEEATYFNLIANDKINETQVNFIAKFDPTIEFPNNLIPVYQYSWDDKTYVTLTTI